MNAITFYDFIVDQISDIKENEDFQKMCRCYTSLLCGLHSLKTDENTDKIQKRFKRFLLLHYYSECTWDTLLSVYKRDIMRYSRQVALQIDSAQHDALKSLQEKLDASIFSQYDFLLKKVK